MSASSNDSTVMYINDVDHTTTPINKQDLVEPTTLAKALYNFYALLVADAIAEHVTTPGKNQKFKNIVRIKAIKFEMKNGALTNQIISMMPETSLSAGKNSVAKADKADEGQ